MARSPFTPLEIENLKKVSENLKRLMKRNGLTQAQLSDRSGIPKGTLSGYVRATSMPNPGNVQKLADALDVTKKDIDPRFDSDAFNAYNLEEAKQKLNEKDGAFFEALIDKTLTLTVEEREKFFSNIEVVLELLDKKKM